MKTACFACDVMIEADTAGAIADAFVAHAAADHDWSYPEKALRNYAMNYAEAAERLTGPTERLTEIGDITIEPVTEDRIDDWLTFFDRDAFADNPDWGSCYCLEPHAPGTDDEPERYWQDTRGMMIERLRSGGTFGYLAYVDGVTAGWVNASKRSDYAGSYADVDGPEPSQVVGVACFVVAPPYRRHGVSAALLDRVLEDATGRGASWVEAYPRDEPEETGDGPLFRGPPALYEERGFEAAQSRERDVVMRRAAKPT